MGKRAELPISEIKHFTSLKAYAKANGIGRKLARAKVKQGEILLFMIRKGRVFVSIKDLQSFLLQKLTNGDS